MIHSIQVKNVDTDGEMSVLGTAGHNGVVVVFVPENSSASYKGLKKDDVLVHCNETAINNVSDFEKCQDVYAQTLEILRGQKHMWI